MAEEFDEKKWKESLREAHEFALKEKDRIKSEIETIVDDVNPLELISHVSLLSQYIPEGKSYSNQKLREQPLLHFLCGLCLKTALSGRRLPENHEVGQVIDLLEKYFIFFGQDLVLQSAKKDHVSESDFIVLSARLSKITSQVNPSIYDFQLDDLFSNLFGQFDDYFFKGIGVTVSDSLGFGNLIRDRYVRLINKSMDEVAEAQNNALKDLEDPVKGAKIREVIKERNLSEQEFLQSYSIFLIFTLTQRYFVFRIEEFCREEQISDVDKFTKYLKLLSCKFGDNSKDYNSPLDENIIFAKPIIKIDDDTCFAPLPNDLIFNIPLIFEKHLECEKQKQTNIWQRYMKQKSKYVEDRIFEYISRLFPMSRIFRNLKYKYKGDECETDILFQYDNKIFIIEAKSGFFTEPAKRGGIIRLERDLRKLIEEAYQQGRRVMDYIKSSDFAVFRDESNKEILRIKYEPQNHNFILINVTFETLSSLATGLKNLQSLGLFLENEFPWSVNLYELDIITRHINSPTIFIHYIERRLAAQDENVFHALDELSFLGWYLDHGNFYVPLNEDGKKPGRVSMSGWVGKFDNHYLNGEEAPKLKIEPELFKIINILEKLHPMGYTDTASALLDFDYKAREFILSNIKESSEKTRSDHSKHDFSIAYTEDLDIGITFMSQYGRKGLQMRLAGYCNMKKYQLKTKRWIGIGQDVLDKDWFVNEFVYLDFPWEYNSEMEKLITEHLSK